MAENDTVPFAEGMPLDDLQIEPFGEDEVLIGDPDSDLPPEKDSAFDDNLAETLDQRLLDRAGSDLVGYYTNDREARSEWENRYKAGLKTLDVEGGLEEG